GGYRGTRPKVGLSATVPVKDAGMRTEPPPSVPTDQVPIPRPTAAAAPPLEPPAVSPGSQGLPVAPCRRLSVTPFQANSGVVFLPRKTDPAARRRATEGASAAHGPDSSLSMLPRRVGQPQVSRMSLMPIGTPSTGPSGSPDRQRAVDRAAMASAVSSSTKTMALTASLW